MNQKVREGIKNTANTIGYGLHATVQSCVSALRMIVLSSPKVAWKSRKYQNLRQSDACCVLGNGPSLKDGLEKGVVKLEGNDVFAVNMFCQSDYFWSIKPRFYFLVDGAYFAPKDDRNNKLVDELIEKMNRVDWSMYLVISTSSPKGRLLNSLENANIKVIRLNSTTLEGFKFLNHYFYSINMGMPRCQTVVNFAICAAINMEYKNVYLYGADHTWTRDLFVDDDNVVCYGDRHVYNKNLTVIKKEGTFAHLLGQFAKMFEAHYELETYSKTRGVKIWNCSSDTFLDAYERLK